MQNQKGSSLVGPFTYTQPLLPYERQLIEVLGISEQEYRHFASEVTARGRQRSAAYAHIPDIRCDPFITPILISIAVGLVLTGVSMLLAPKPVMPKSRGKDEDDPITQKNMGDLQGRTRFNGAVGFDSAPQVALLGSRIPLIFGQYIDGKDPSGGIMVEPLLVWSRMFANNSFQTMEAVMTLGNATISKAPDLAGCMIGGTPIDTIYSTNYAVSWSAQKGSNRLGARDIIYGMAESARNKYGLFVCPTTTGDAKGGFCMASTPSNTTSFGVYASIPNGGAYKVNWRVVSIPEQAGTIKEDPKHRLENERRKIAGKLYDHRAKGMGGTGRVYSPKCGVIRIDDVTYDKPGVASIKVGSELTYRISGTKFTVGNTQFVYKSEVTPEDINHSVIAIRDKSEAGMQLNEVFIMNQALLRVTRRPNTVWEPGKTRDYKLECIGFVGSSRRVAAIGSIALRRPVLYGDGLDSVKPLNKPAAWFCLSKIDLGQFKNTRPSEVTEIGIRSQVWSRASGLCIFSNIPKPRTLYRYDKNRVQLNAGRQSRYMMRSSFFVLGVKLVGSTKNDDLDGFDTFEDALFCVRGNTPTDVFNSITIHHPELGEYEFRFTPVNHTNLTRYKEPRTICYSLNTSAKRRSLSQKSSHYGTFQLKFNADIFKIKNLFELEEFEAPYPRGNRPRSGRVFESNAQVKEFFAYDEVTTSCESSPEHEIVYVNESRNNKTLPEYSDMAMFGLKLRSMNQVQSFRQLQVWLYDGIDIDRYLQSGKGPSNNLADIVKYVLSIHHDGSGLGLEISERLIDEDGLRKSALFLDKNGLRFDGAISDGVNIRDYFSSLAPLLLCNFVVANGKFSMVPGVPVDNSGRMLSSPVPIAQYFNDSTVIKGSYSLDFLPQTERMQFRAVMKYRKSIKNSLTEVETIMVAWGDEPALPSPQEDYDMTTFCTRESQAFMTARYLLSLRRRVDHTITFQTLPDGLALKPGDYIRYDSIASPYSSLHSGVIRADGKLLSVNPPANGTYFAYLYLVGADDVTEANLVISRGKVTDSNYFGALFNIPDQGTPGEAGSIPVRCGVYLAEEISLGEDGLVQITASHFPVNENGVSKIVEDVLDQDLFEVIT